MIHIPPEEEELKRAPLLPFFASTAKTGVIYRKILQKNGFAP